MRALGLHTDWRTSRRLRVLLFALASSVALSACGGAASATSASGSTGAVAVSAAPSSSPVAAPAAARKVNANTATQGEIEQALQANGVPNAARWAREVVEYRPYPTDDPSFGKLRQELAKYNPSPDVVDKIVASLSL